MMYSVSRSWYYFQTDIVNLARWFIPVKSHAAFLCRVEKVPFQKMVPYGWVDVAVGAFSFEDACWVILLFVVVAFILIFNVVVVIIVVSCNY